MKSLILALAIAVPLFSQITSYPTSQIVSGQMQVNQPNGVPQLDANGHVASAQQVSQLSSRISTGLNVVFEGDSLSASSNSFNYPQYLEAMSSLAGRAVFNNFAVSGNKITDLQARYTASVHPLSPAVSGQPGILIVWIGANDYDWFTPASSIESQYTTYMSGAKADGWTLVWTTIMRRGDQTDPTGNNENIRVTVNQWLRSQQQSGAYDRLIDADRFFTNPFDANLFQPDHIHPTAGGSYLYAKFVNQALWGEGEQLPGTEADSAVMGAGSLRGNWNVAPLSTGADMTGNGWQAGQSLTTGNNDSFYGYHALLKENTGSNNTCIGYIACEFQAGMSNNTGVGFGAIANALLGDNVAIGANAGLQGAALNLDVLIGSGAGKSYNDIKSVIIGNSAAGGASAITGSNAVIIGFNAGLNQTGIDSTIIGSGAGQGVTGNNNTCIGTATCTSLTSGQSDVALGVSANFGATVTGSAQIGSGTTASSNTMQFQAIIVTKAAGAFSTLPTCASGIEGSTAPVTDSTTATYAATITGSGTNHVRAYCNGANWVVD